jgi:hypothetical protein
MPPEARLENTQCRIFEKKLYATVVIASAAILLTVILHRCGIERTFETVMSVYERQALDIHVNRKRFRKNGLNKNGRLEKRFKVFYSGVFLEVPIRVNN